MYNNVFFYDLGASKKVQSGPESLDGACCAPIFLRWLPPQLPPLPR